MTNLVVVDGKQKTPYFQFRSDFGLWVNVFSTILQPVGMVWLLAYGATAYGVAHWVCQQSVMCR